MILLLDQGNTRLKWRLLRSGADVAGAGSGAGSLAEAADCIAAGGGKAALQAVLVASVAAPEITRQLLGDSEVLFGLTPRHLVAVRQCGGLKNGYLEPGKLGVDRWLAMLGARESGAESFLVVDAGTAVTIDVVMGGVHRGGYILPGLSMQRASLGYGTARVGAVTGRAVAGLGLQTATCVLNGTARAVAELASAALIELQQAVGDTCPLFVTGGDVSEIVTLLRGGPIMECDDLVFRGMVVQWRAAVAQG